jgi:uncharacterized surface protein with fasciclin (FAS1) repeats
MSSHKLAVFLFVPLAASAFGSAASAQTEPLAPPMSPPTMAPQMPPSAAPPIASTDVPPADLPDPAKIAPTSTVIQNAANSPDHTVLTKAIKMGGLEEVLSAAGPFTLFAPTNAGFERLPPGTVDTLLKPENQGSLAKILKNHVATGKLTAGDLGKKIKAGKGKTRIEMLSGDVLIATSEGTTIKLSDSNGNTSVVDKADIMGSNGIIHSIGGVLIPGEKKPQAPAR